MDKWNEISRFFSYSGIRVMVFWLSGKRAFFPLPSYSKFKLTTLVLLPKNTFERYPMTLRKQVQVS